MPKLGAERKKLNRLSFEYVDTKILKIFSLRTLGEPLLFKSHHPIFKLRTSNCREASEGSKNYFSRIIKQTKIMNCE